MALSRNFCHNLLNQLNNVFKRNQRDLCTRALTLSEVRRKRNELFSKEKARQMAHITRIEKIKVEYVGLPEPCTLLMNKGLSTPFNCAMHINELLMRRSVLALVNGLPWDMHRPITEDSELNFLHFKDEDPDLCNQAYWRSCSFVLGYILETAFKDNYFVELCSFPRPNVRSGSFVYDADLKLEAEWKPTDAEMRCLGRIGTKLQYDDLRFERINVDASVALKMFENNRFKCAQIPSIAAQSSTGSEVTVYRMGDHVDITRGPLMSSTQQIGRFSVSALHDIESVEFGRLVRVQGMSIPSALPVHFWAYDKLCQRAATLNRAPVPRLYTNKDSDTQKLSNGN